ncbi:MAG: succinylglutamate desuccinylase/aspartoacylase family protein [Deltaproteobacteria bacterium]|nr:succinylglutamate desuccinylase/aspartoacylase family protein [Deltaproteobacteria bacterium]
MAKKIKIGSSIIEPGSIVSVQLPLPGLYTQSKVFMPVQVLHGEKSGPTLFVSAAIHGDEINGIEIIRRVLKFKALKKIVGTLIAIPVVNIYGLINHSRYLPDRRDLNRSFPGSPKGSLAARLADLFLNEIVKKCDYGIDIHTGSWHRINLPQIRACMDDKKTRRIAKAFGAPVILNSNIRDGSLRQSVNDLGIPMLLYEGGEALRFDELAIRAGVRGVLNIMRELKMIPGMSFKPKKNSLISKKTYWVRANVSGILRTIRRLGSHVKKGETLGVISDPFGMAEEKVTAIVSGVIIGKSNLPVVNAGEALYHIAKFREDQEIQDAMNTFHEELNPEEQQGILGEPPIV